MIKIFVACSILVVIIVGYVCVSDVKKESLKFNILGLVIAGLMIINMLTAFMLDDLHIDTYIDLLSTLEHKKTKVVQVDGHATAYTITIDGKEYTITIHNEEHDKNDNS